MWGLDALIFVSVSLLRENLRELKENFKTQNPNPSQNQIDDLENL